jgi:diphthamide biosynthesis protein 4
MTEDHYQMLGVARDASHAAIRAAYHAKLLIHHPDKLQHRSSAEGPDIASGVGDEGELASVMQAWAVLKDPDLKERYDKQLLIEGLRESVSSINFYDEVNLSEMEEMEEMQGEGEGEVGVLDSAFVMQCRCGDYFRLLKRTAEEGEKGGSIAVPCDSCSNVIRVHFK